MSLSKEILRITARYHPIGYKQLFEYLYEETVYGKKINKSSVHTIINRMEKKGLIEKGKHWSVTPDGKVFLNKEDTGLKKFFDKTKFHKNIQKEKQMIAIFDIPEKRKRYREWLRLELIGFGFTFIQKSVWLGPPLPKEFVKYLSEVGILKYVKFFHVTEKDLI